MFDWLRQLWTTKPKVIGHKESTVSTPEDEATSDNLLKTALWFDNNQCVTVTPAKLKWTLSGGIQQITISNGTSARLSLKVKATDNALYSASPVYTFIEAGEETVVHVVRHSGYPKSDKPESMAFAFAQASMSASSPKSAFIRGALNPMIIASMLLDVTSDL